MLSVPCPKCGGTNIFDETKQIPTYCSFCSAHLPNMDAYVQEALKLKVENELLNMEKQRHQMEMEKEEKDKYYFYVTKICVIILAIFFIICSFISTCMERSEKRFIWRYCFHNHYAAGHYYFWLYDHF